MFLKKVSCKRFVFREYSFSRTFTSKKDPNKDDLESKRDVPIEGAEIERSYMKRRLQQLAEEAAPSSVDPNAGRIEDALPYNKIEMHAKLEKIQNDPSNFEYQHQQAIGVSKLPLSASKLTRDIAMAKPWSGVESHYDASLRMLNDSIKPKKVRKTSNTIITPPQHVRDRIHDAKEGALDYRLAKISGGKKDKKKEDDDNWAEMYKERLLGPSMLLNDSFASVDNSIKSLADQKIMEAQRRGDFKNIRRGKPLEKGYGATENMFIDRTEYHLNQILKRQDALPPWIEKQGGCDLRILRFRQELDREWLKWVLMHVKDKFPAASEDELIAKMETYAKTEMDGDSKGERLRGDKWLQTRRAYLESKIRDLNDTIRGYNLQAPLSSQKLYLLLDKELAACYKRVAPHLVDAFKRHLRGDQRAGGLGGSGSGSGSDSDTGVASATPSYASLPQRENVYQHETESLTSMLKKMFW